MRGGGGSREGQEDDDQEEKEEEKEEKNEDQRTVANRANIAEQRTAVMARSHAVLMQQKQQQLMQHQPRRSIYAMQLGLRRTAQRHYTRGTSQHWFMHGNEWVLSLQLRREAPVHTSSLTRGASKPTGEASTHASCSLSSSEYSCFKTHVSLKILHSTKAVAWT